MLSIFSNTDSVAIYSAAYQLTLVLFALGAPYSYSVLPLLGERWATKDITGMQAIIRRSTRATLILLIPAIVGLAITGTSLLKVLATDQFAQSGIGRHHRGGGWS